MFFSPDRLQEIINRMDVKGILNKRLTRILLDEDIDIPCDVFIEDSSTKPVGTITSRTHTPFGIMGLAILRKTAWGNGQTVMLQDDGRKRIGKVLESKEQT